MFLLDFKQIFMMVSNNNLQCGYILLYLFI